MSLRDRRICLVAVLFLICSTARAELVGIAPVDNMPRPGLSGSSDFMALFTTPDSWPISSKITKVFVLSARYAAVGPEDDLRRIIAWLKQHGMALAVGIGPLSGDGQCGKRVEGYSAPGEPVSIAMRMKRFGADLKYVGLDEPMFFGHLYTGKNACHASIQDIAREVAVKVAQIKSIFPDVEISDGEPITSFPGNDWAEKLEQWLDAYHDATGQQLRAFHFDLAWHLEWRQRVARVLPMLRARGIEAGLIVTGGGRAESDREWVDQALTHYNDYTRTFGTPALVTFSSWMKHPTRVLPESDPTTFTGLLVRFGQVRGSAR